MAMFNLMVSANNNVAPSKFTPKLMENVSATPDSAELEERARFALDTPTPTRKPKHAKVVLKIKLKRVESANVNQGKDFSMEVA